MKEFKAEYINRVFPNIKVVAMGFQSPFVHITRFRRQEVVHIDDFRMIYRKVRDLP